MASRAGSRRTPSLLPGGVPDCLLAVRRLALGIRLQNECETSTPTVRGGS